MVGKRKNRRRCAERFKNFQQACLTFNNCKQKRSSSEEKNGNCYIFANAAGQFYLLSYCLTADIWAFPSGLPIPFKNCPEAFQWPLGISQRLFYTLIAVLSGYPTTFKSISQRLSAKT
jgi:hypothetical protein